MDGVSGEGAENDTRGRVCSPEQLRAQRVALNKKLADDEKQLSDTITTEARALLKQRFDYPVFLYAKPFTSV